MVHLDIFLKKMSDKKIINLVTGKQNLGILIMREFRSTKF